MSIVYNPEEWLKKVPTMKETDMKNPKCVNCNECCSIHTLISKKERIKIFRYLEANPELRDLVIARTEERFAVHINLKCPFSNDETKKCDIYNIRPEICREYHCTPKLKGPNINKLKKKHKIIIGDIFDLSEERLLNMVKKVLTPKK
jgi:Fe-S-cluster containining protein